MYIKPHLREHVPKRNSQERRAELAYRRHKQRLEKATIFENVISKYIPAGEHRNVPKDKR